MKKEFVFRVVLAAAIFFLVYQFGFKPMFHRPDNHNTEERMDLSVQLDTSSGADYDVIVYGGEPQGISAAVSAARLGARTLLICEGGDVGGTVTECMIPELEVPSAKENLILNRGILGELYKDLGIGFSGEKYLTTVQAMLGAEKKLSILYNTTIQGINPDEENIESLRLLSDGKAKVISGRMFIDASDSASLLDICKVPYFTGSGDLNLPESFVPVSLNFEMVPPSEDEKNLEEGKNRISETKKLVNNTEKMYKGLKEYEPLDLHTRLDELKICVTDQGKVIFEGLQISGVNVTDSKAMDKALRIARKEAENLALFVSRQFEPFRDWKLSRTADKLWVRESRHYAGKSILAVSSILANKYFDDTVAMGSYPVSISKFANKGSYFAGKPVAYGIPLGCLVPDKITNLLMAGPRISYSSLASTSAGTIGTNIAIGESTGAIAVFCLAKNENPAFLVNGHEKLDEFRAMLTAQGMYLPKQTIAGANEKNWSYPAARQLLSLGLVAGGKNNNLNFNKAAKQKDLAYILLNGIYRLDMESYSLEMDARIRPLITEDALSFDNAVKLLGALYNIDGKVDEIYRQLCIHGRINDVMQLRMKDKKPLVMEDVYYLGAYSIRSYTGKDIPE